MTKKIPVSILGATGSVGQRFVQLLDEHPFFEVVSLTGSDAKAGKYYGETCHWILSEPMPEWARRMTLISTTKVDFNVPLVFSALPTKHASFHEPLFAKRGVAVCSNAGAFRRDSDIPILLPEINPDHLKIIKIQKQKRNWKGFIVTNPNCTSTGTSIVLNALKQEFGIKRCFGVSMQALSGAGYPGVSSLDMLDNVIPFIQDEEEKLEWEPRKILGTVENSKINLANFQLSAHCNRVAVSDGHMVCLSVEFDALSSKTIRKDVIAALKNYKIPIQSQDLPSSPDPAIVVAEGPDRPQPKLDRNNGHGMSTTVGRIRGDKLFHIKLVVLSHNTIRGAAGGSIYNAELLVSEGYI